MTLHNQANKGLQKNNKIYSHNIIDQTRIKLRDNWWSQQVYALIHEGEKEKNEKQQETKATVIGHHCSENNW